MITIKKLGYIFLFVGLIIGLVVPAIQIRPFSFKQYTTTLIEDYYANISTDFVNIAITLLLVDSIIAKKDLNEKKEKLKRGLRNQDFSRVDYYVGELKTSGWIEDGTLEGIDLMGANLSKQELNNASLAKANLLGANLEGSYLFEADLRDAILIKANLQEAKLSGSNMESVYLEGAILEGSRMNRVNLSNACFSEATSIKDASLMKANLTGATGLSDSMLSTTHSLRGAIMPDGDVYDGRFSLTGDLEFAKIDKINVQDLKAMKKWYLEGAVNENINQ